jgi:hypothetical protein
MSPDKTMACKKLLIFGATGLIGKYITQAIVENKDKFDRIAIFTSQGTVQSKADQIDALKKQGVDVIVGDVTNSEDVVKAYQGGFLCIWCYSWEMSLIHLGCRYRHSHIGCWQECHRATGRAGPICK